jgi:DNA-directed RNA polymerase specialized sigma24 family protein
MAIVIPKVPTQDIDEVVSDVLADFFLYIEKGIPVPHVRALLNTIGRRRIADFHRNREGAPPTAAFDAERHEHVHSSDRMEDERIGQVLTNDILDGLPSELRSVAYARFVAYLSVEQTAEELNLTIDMVKKRSQLARAQLRVIVSEGFRYDA